MTLKCSEDIIIVSRHPAAVEWLRQQVPELVDAPVLAEATAEDVRGKIVYGNLPLHLAAAAYAVVAIEFSGQPPRGREYSVAGMEVAGAHLRTYTVNPAPYVTIQEGALCGDGHIRSTEDANEWYREHYGSLMSPWED